MVPPSLNPLIHIFAANQAYPNEPELMTERHNNVSIIIPAYNEETGIKSTLESLVAGKYHEKYEIIVVDDGSTDKTREICEGFPVRVISHSVNKGYGAALKTGIRKSTSDRVAFMDSDGQHDPKYLDELVEMLDDYEMVIGCRSEDSFQVKNRKAGKKVIRMVGEFLVEQKLPDYNSGFRGFEKNLIRDMLHFMPNGFSFSTTSTLAFMKEGYNIGTFPIVVEERVGRKSNVKFVKDGTKTLMLLLRIIMLFNPLKIFLPASLVTGTAGIVFGIWGFVATGRFPNGAIILVTLGMILFFIGLIADQISLLNRKH
jgi:glycosyltransferase involved in cell wall biosynthesis